MVCRILVADDSTPIQKVIKIAFSKYAVEIATAGTLAEAIKESERFHPELVIADSGLPGVSTASDFKRLLSHSQGAAIVMLMGSFDAVREADLHAAGLGAVLKKPFDALELLDACEKLLPGKMEPNPVGQFSRSNVLPEPQNLPPPPSGRGQEPTRAPITPVTGVPSFLLETNPPLEESAASLDVDSAKKGLPAFDPRTFPSFESERLGKAPPLPKTPSQNDFMPGSMNVDSELMEEIVRRELPGLVERAVQKYCHEHFKGLAKDVITAELRRLADEKARYLVDT
jgi:CheY-like chemotaxis protein